MVSTGCAASYCADRVTRPSAPPIRIVPTHQQDLAGFNVGLVVPHEALRSALRFLLLASGFHVREYRSAGEYLSAPVNPHHCVIVDCRLRDMPARRLCERIVGDEKALPVVALTDSPEEFQPCREANPLVRIVGKPFVGQVLIDSVNEAISSSAAGRPSVEIVDAGC